MKLFSIFFFIAFIVSGCSFTFPFYKKIPDYNGPRITKIIVNKSQRSMFLLNNDKIIQKFKIKLGFNPISHKIKQGDGRTPEGEYYIDRKNPNSKYFLSLGISYPNVTDVKYATKLGLNPGKDIFIHGGPQIKDKLNINDWTAGCISVSDKNIKIIYSMVEIGTPILIKP
jgi:murein L,D-transpeptidase YafK